MMKLIGHLSMSLTVPGTSHLSITPAAITTRILYSFCWMQEQTQMQGTTLLHMHGTTLHGHSIYVQVMLVIQALKIKV